ncbi:unnamed protein product [Spirodela intermedia]|uniref:Uncharacterized protein n=1 Tax=Spirodela intermedia TaxID=51605 RepID=A0ABN7E9Z5_SPIIN|nr:unnamed protein product [Spirodela intermedia]
MWGLPSLGSVLGHVFDDLPHRAPTSPECQCSFWGRRSNRLKWQCSSS